MFKMRYKNEYRRSIEEYKPAIPIRRKIGPYWILAALRFTLTAFQQTGYIHPDEFFQSIEVISGDRFDIKIYKPWEYNTTFPIRSAFIPQLMVGIPYTVLRKLSPYMSYFFGISLMSPFYLVLFPRMLMCTLSFISDYCLYKICYMYGQNYKMRLITLASSYVILVYATRTFSNSIELILSSLLLYYASECMAFSEKVVTQSDNLSDRYNKAKTGVERVKYYKLLASLPSHSLNHCFKIATITVIGIFNRPTFVAYAFPPIFFWLQRGLGSKTTGFGDFNVRILTLILCGIPATVFFILADSMYFGYLTVGEVINWEVGINNFVVTPLNFLKYNSNAKNLETHGLHPRFLHFAVNVPLLFNVLGVIGLFTFGKMLCSGLKGRWLDLPRIQSIVGLMSTSFVVPIALLSIFPHQEPRFIIPAVFPLVFLYAPNLSHISGTDTVARVADIKDQQPMKGRKLTKLQVVWFVYNILMTMFYGFGHQGGVLPLTSRIAAELKTKPDLTHIHLYTSYTYSVPTALLHLRNTERTYVSSSNHKYRLTKDFYLYEQGSRDIANVYFSLKLKLQECENRYKYKRIPYRLYYALPASAYDEFVHYSFSRDTRVFKYYTVAELYPHISTEKLPSYNFITDIINIGTTNDSITDSLQVIGKSFKTYLQQFGLLLIKIEKSSENATLSHSGKKAV